MRLFGSADTTALLGLGAAAAAASPQLAGTPAGAGLLLPSVAAGAWLTWRALHNKYSRVNLEPKEGFVIRSDEPYSAYGAEGLRLGYTTDEGRPANVTNNDLMRHLAIIGQSGVGKTTLGEYLLWQQVSRGGGYIFIDAKLDAGTRDKLAYMARVTGREHEFYVLNVDNPPNSHTYNPLLQGDADEVSSRLLNLQPSTETNAGADFYKQSTNHALTTLIAALQDSGYRYHFGDLVILLQSAQAMAGLERMVPEGRRRMALQVFLDQYRKRTKEGVVIDTDRIKQMLGGMVGRMSQFAQDKFGAVFNTYTPEIDLTDIIVNNKMLYVMLPTMGKDVAALNLGKMVLSDLRTAVYRVQSLPAHKRPNPPFMVFADEMGSYVMPGIARVFEQARSARICMVPAFQSFANLATVGSDFEDIIIQNTWSKIIFKFGSIDSSEKAAELIGKTIRYAHSVSASKSSGDSASSIRTTPQASKSENASAGESWRENEVYRVTPDQLRALRIGEAIGVVGPRMYHLNTPMLNFPSVLPEFKPLRHPVSLPPGVHTLDYEQRYKEFLVAGGDTGPEPLGAI